MIDRVVYDWAPFVALVAVATFVLDWSLTHVGAAASRKVRDRYAFEGSYELNPTWEADIDAGRRFTWRMVGVAVVLAALLLAMRYVVEIGELDPAFFALAAGAVLLIQAPTIMAHATNLQMFRGLADPSAVTGSITFNRWLIVRQAASYLIRFAVLWLLLWLPSQQAFFLGGALACAMFGVRLARLPTATRPAKASAAAAPLAPAGDEPLTIP